MVLSIYKIVNDVDDFIYVGSTFSSLNKKFREHLILANLNKQQKIYIHMNKIGINKFRIELIKTIDEDENES